MKLSEFIGLSEDCKRFTVLNQGVPIAKRLLENRMIFLFQLQEYYVETVCCCETKDILEYRAFQATKQLEPYLNNIRIDHLLS